VYSELTTHYQALFYCHFPDKLLCVERKSLLKQAYRAILDYVEEITTGVIAAYVLNHLC
jgi:hypothetical protein